MNSSTPGTQRVGHLLLAGCALFWGPNPAIVKSAYHEINPVLFAALRFTLCGGLVFGLTLLRERDVRVRGQDLWKIAVAGGLGIGLYQILWSCGLARTTASNSALIFAVTPLLGALYGNLTQREILTREQYLCMFLAFVGVLLIILKPTASLRLSTATLPGDLLSLAASLCFVVFFSSGSKPLLSRYSPLRLTGYCMVVASIVLWIFSLSTVQHAGWTQTGKTTWLSLGYAILFSGLLGHVFWYEGIQRVGVTKSLVYQYVTVVWAVGFNAFFMGEEIFSQQVIGGMLILVSVHRIFRT